jgi:hypothetical protein
MISSIDVENDCRQGLKTRYAYSEHIVGYSSITRQ